MLVAEDLKDNNVALDNTSEEFGGEPGGHAPEPEGFQDMKFSTIKKFQLLVVSI